MVKEFGSRDIAGAAIKIALTKDRAEEKQLQQDWQGWASVRQPWTTAVNYQFGDEDNRRAVVSSKRRRHTGKPWRRAPLRGDQGSVVPDNAESARTQRGEIGIARYRTMSAYPSSSA